MCHILVVDDTRSVHAYLKSLLAPISGIKITDVFNGAEAIEVLAANQSFSVILLDWEMPVLDGIGTLRKLGEMGCPIPVVMMTTKNSPEEIGAALEAGAGDFIMKPFTLDILLEKIETFHGKPLNYAS